MLQVTKTIRNRLNFYIGIIVNKRHDSVVIVKLYIYSYDNVYNSITIEVSLHKETNTPFTKTCYTHSLHYSAHTLPRKLCLIVSHPAPSDSGSE